MWTNIATRTERGAITTVFKQHLAEQRTNHCFIYVNANEKNSFILLSLTKKRLISLL